MCDQTEIKYVDGDIVWVKFHNFWWPGEVHGESKLPPDLLKSFRKMPVAVVKFFQENAYEYVKTINDIYSYNCIRKHEFIKKGLDLHRAKKRNMEKFPEDVRIAEEKTGGDPDIIDSEEFQPEQKPNIANIFGDQTPKAKKGFGRGRRKATPSDDELTYSRTKNISLKSAHATPTLSTPKSFISSSSAMNRSPAIASTSTSTPNANEFRCHLCNFSTTRLNVIVLHNKTHASETKPIDPPSAGKAKKTPIVTPGKKSPPKPRGRKPKPKPNEIETAPVQNDYESEDVLPQTSDSECERKKVTAKKLTKPSPKKRQSKKSAATALASINIDSDEATTPTLKPTAVRKGPRSTRKKLGEEIVVAESVKPAKKPVEIKSKLLADWDEEDDDSMVSTSKEVTSEVEDIKSVISSPAQSGDENQPKKAIRNIPKKDRRGNIFDEFYVKQVPSTNETDTEGEQTVKDDTEGEQTVKDDTEGEQTVKDDTVVIESDDDICGFVEDEPKVSEIAEEKPTKSEGIVEPEESNVDEVVESTTDIQETEEIPPKNDDKSEDDVDLLKQSAELLEETSLLQKNIESVGVIEKKRRLLRKHKNDEDTRSSSIEESIEENIVEQPKEEPIETENQIDEKPRGRRRSSSKTPITQTITKTYRSSSRRKTKSTSGDEKGQLQSNEQEKNSVKGNGLDNLANIEEDVEMKPIESTISADQNDDDKDSKVNVKIEDDEMSPSKSELDPNKIEVDCFDFKEEEDEVPQTLNRRKRRCLPPGKVFELQTIDKLEEIRKKEEDEKSKRIKLEPEDKEIIISSISIDEMKNNSFDEVSSPEKPGEKPSKDDDIKDSKALPPKERGKRIFKSRNRSRLSEGDSFSNDEKSPTKESNQSFDSIEKSLADSTIESPTTAENTPIKIDNESVPNESLAKEEINSTVKIEESQIESEVANTLITLTNSPAKVTESIVTSTEKEATSSDDVMPANENPTEAVKEIEVKEVEVEVQVKEIEVPTSSKITETVEAPKEIQVESKPKPKPKPSVVINAPAAKKRKSVNEKDESANETKSATNVTQPPKQAKTSNTVEKSIPSVNVNVMKRVTVAQSSTQIRDAGDGLLIKPNPQASAPKIVTKPATEVSAVSSTSTSPPQQQQKQQQTQPQKQQQNHPQQPKLQQKPPQPQAQLQPQPPTQLQPQPQPQPPQQQQNTAAKSTRKKIPVTIGYDVLGNAIVTYRKPSNKPVVHLPSHIPTPDLAVNPALLPTKPNPSTQFVITSKGALLKTTACTTVSQTPTTSMSPRPQIVRQNASTSAYSPQIKSPPMPTIHMQTHQSINPHLIHKQPSAIHKADKNQIQMHQFIQHQQLQQQQQQHQMKVGPQIKQKITTNIVQHAQPSLPKPSVNVKPTNRPNKKQQEMLMRKQQESVITHHQPEQVQSTEVLQNAEDNQLLAIPAENFDGPAGAFYLCRITENNDYIPIDSQPLYLDEKNQLIPGNLINAVIQEELVEETPQVSHQFEYQQEQVVQNVEEPSNLKYLLNVDGQQILLDQQSLLQLTSGGEMQQLVTADGQRLILQGSPQDILAAIQSSQQEQIIIPSDMIEEDPNNHDILAAALEDTGVFPQSQDQQFQSIFQPNGMEDVDPLTFQTIHQAPTSETNAILPPIMSTLEQPSKTVSSPNMDCSNIEESLAVIGVSAPSTNVPVSLELPITVTNPAIAPKTTNAISTIYPSNVPTSLQPQALHANQLSPIVSDILSAAISSSLTKSTAICSTIESSNSISEAVFIQEDENCEIVPNTPESVINHGFTSDNSNSSEIPLQSNLILRPPSIESMERDEADNGDDELERRQRRAQNNNNNCNNNHNNTISTNNSHGIQQHNEHAENSRTDVESLILNDNSFDHHDAALLLANSRPGFQAITVDSRETNFTRTNRTIRRNRHRNTNHCSDTAANDEESPIFIIEQNIIENSEFDTDDVSNVEHFNS